MARKKAKRSINIFPIIIILLICLGLSFVLIKFFKNSLYFTIKEVTYSDEDKTAEINRIISLKNKNIFSVDLKAASKKLKNNYPEYEEIKVSRQLPNKVMVNLIKRVPFAILRFSQRYYIFDEEAVVLKSISSRDGLDLTLINGLDIAFKDIRTGQRLISKNVSLAIDLLKQINSEFHSTNFECSQIDIENQNKISLVIDDVQIFITRDDFKDKLKILKPLLEQLRPEFKDIVYIDMRFHDPVIKKR